MTRSRSDVEKISCDEKSVLWEVYKKHGTQGSLRIVRAVPGRHGAPRAASRLLLPYFCDARLPRPCRAMREGQSRLCWWRRRLGVAHDRPRRRELIHAAGFACTRDGLRARRVECQARDGDSPRHRGTRRILPPATVAFARMVRERLVGAVGGTVGRGVPRSANKNVYRHSNYGDCYRN